MRASVQESQALRALNFLLATKVGAPGLAYQLAQMWGRREGEVVGLDSCQKSDASIKTESDFLSFIFLKTNL